MNTKTWQEKFEQEYWGKFGSTKTINDIKQFISELRKKDEEELINNTKELDSSAWRNQTSLTTDEFIQLIKDYYTK